MSTTMASKGCWVQLTQSNMRLVLIIAKMAQGGFSHTAIEETQHLVEKPRAEVPDQKKQEVEIPGDQKVKATMERHPAMVYKNHQAGCLTCQDCTAKSPESRWRRKGTDARLPEPVAPLSGRPSPPGTPPAPPGDAERIESYEIDSMPFSCLYMHSPLPNTQFFNHNAFAKNSKHDNYCIPDLLSTPFAAWRYH